MSTKNRADVELKAIKAIVLFIILGNIIIKPPMLFHAYGHFGIINHPIKTIHEIFFVNYGYLQDCFVFSLKGLQMYFNSIPIMYDRMGVVKATFAYLTQFSPVWTFVPLKLLYDCFVEFISNISTNNNEDSNSENINNKSFLKLIIFIIAISLCVLISKCTTISKSQKQVTPVEYENQSNKNSELMEKNDNDLIYKKIGVSKECYDNCKMYIDAEGYLPENYGGCSADENKKIQEYAKDHPDMFE